MAKSSRAGTRKRNVALRLKKYQPVVLEQTKKRNVRLTAYMALQKVRAAEKKGDIAPIDEQTLIAAQHGAELETNDEQKRRLRDNGHFFFVHPTTNKDKTFPIVNKPTNIEEYSVEMNEEDKNIKMTQLDYLHLEKARGKKMRAKKVRDRLRLRF